MSMLLLFSSPILIWIYYLLTEKIGKDQEYEWKEFVESHPHFFKVDPPQPVVKPQSWQDKFMEGVWERYRKQHHIEKDQYEP